MKRKNSLEEISTKRQKVAPVKGVEAEIEEMEADFPDLSARIAALSPALELAVRAGDAVQVSAIIQEYNDYVDATYSDHVDYGFTPSISVDLEHLGVLANRMGFDEIADILGYEDNQESEDDEDTNTRFPGLPEIIESLSPALTAAVESNNAVQVAAIIQQYDNYVYITYGEHIVPSYVELALGPLAVLAHERGFHEICTVFQYEDCQLSGAEPSFEL